MTLRKKRKQKQITEMVRTLILVKIGFDDSEKEEKTEICHLLG